MTESTVELTALFEQLEQKIHQSLETIGLLQLELEEAQREKGELEAKLATSCEERAQLLLENERLKDAQQRWQDRIRSLIGKLHTVEE